MGGLETGVTGGGAGGGQGWEEAAGRLSGDFVP